MVNLGSQAGLPSDSIQWSIGFKHPLPSQIEQKILSYTPWNEHSPYKWTVGVLVSFSDGLFSGAMLVWGRVINLFKLRDVPAKSLSETAKTLRTSSKFIEHQYPPGNHHISHLGNRKIIIKIPLRGDMLVPRRRAKYHQFVWGTQWIWHDVSYYHDVYPHPPFAPPQFPPATTQSRENGIGNAPLAFSVKSKTRRSLSYANKTFRCGYDIWRSKILIIIHPRCSTML